VVAVARARADGHKGRHATHYVGQGSDLIGGIRVDIGYDWGRRPGHHSPKRRRPRPQDFNRRARPPVGLTYELPGPESPF
jgi:hypothetical protein